jgi:chemotaxis protein methyltransferase CheR
MRILGAESHARYLELVLSDPVELVALLDAVTTNETRFFREPTQFDYLEEHFLPWLRAVAERGGRRRAVRAWSAGCSTGEEPFSIAMLLRSALPEERGWTLDVVGTDLSTRALAHANRAVWSSESLEHIPPRFHRFTMRGVRSREGWIRMAPELRSAVRFTRVNLAQIDSRFEGPFDLVFCRNVLIYFRAERRRAVVEQLVRRLVPDGLFLLGHSESLAGSSVSGLRGVGPMIYCQAGARWQRPRAAREDGSGRRR